MDTPTTPASNPDTTPTPSAAGSDAATAPGAASTPPAGGGRLPAGELRRQVASYLADHPGDTFTPGQVAAALGGRSSGAVGNALAMLAGHGHADLAADAPRRYGATSTTPGAAAGPARAPLPVTTPASTPVAASTGAAPAPTSSTTTGSVPPGSAATGSSPGAGEPRATRPGRARRAKTAPVTAPTGDSAGDVVTGPITRPNGTLYRPRTLSGMADVTALRKLRAAGVPALLYGPPGTGKTSVIEAAFADLVTVAGDGDTTVADLVGEYTQTPEGRYVFVHGSLIRAMREGRPLFIDDATLIPPSVLAVVYPAMDGRREIIVKANGGESVRAVEGFYVIAGHNPNVHGAILTDALSSRFSVQIQVSTDFELAKQLGIDSRATRVARNLAARQERGEIGWSPQLRELIAFQRISEVLGGKAAAANLVGIAPEADRETVADVVRRTFGEALEPLALGAQITPGTPEARTGAEIIDAAGREITQSGARDASRALAADPTSTPHAATPHAASTGPAGVPGSPTTYATPATPATPAGSRGNAAPLARTA
jgi:MoxR-like ATPase